MAKTITLLDIAADAGVSRATVSLVMRDSPLVAAETRERVLDSAERLGYVYHRVAANLRSQRSGAVGVGTIAFVGGAEGSPRRERSLGLRAELGERGRDPSTLVSIPSPPTREGGYAAAAELLRAVAPT